MRHRNIVILILFCCAALCFGKSDPVLIQSPNYNNVLYFNNEYTHQYDGVLPSSVTFQNNNTYNSYSTSNSFTYNVTYTTAYVSNSGTWWDLAPSGWLQMNDSFLSDSEWALDTITGYLEMK